MGSSIGVGLPEETLAQIKLTKLVQLQANMRANPERMVPPPNIVKRIVFEAIGMPYGEELPGYMTYVQKLLNERVKAELHVPVKSSSTNPIILELLGYRWQIGDKRISIAIRDVGVTGNISDIAIYSPEVSGYLSMNLAKPEQPELSVFEAHRLTPHDFQKFYDEVLINC